MTLTYQQQKDFSRGITDDRFLGQGYVSDAESVNIRKQSRGVFLSNDYADITYGTVGTSFSNIIYAIFTAKGATDSDIFALTNTRVYDILSGTSADFGGAFIGGRNAGIIKSAGTNYGILITKTAIWRWNNDTTSIGLATNYMSLTGSSEYRPYVYDGGFLYVGGDGKVDAIDVSTSTWVISKTTSLPGVCRGISFIGDQIIIYTNDGLNGYRASWDGVSAYPQYLQKWSDNPVINIANAGNIDYVVTGTGETNTNKYRRIFVATGWDKKILYGGDYINYSKQLFNFSPTYTNAIETNQNTIYIPSNSQVYGLGNTKASLPMSLIKDYIIDDNVGEITSLYIKDQSTMYVGYYQDTSPITNKVVSLDLRDGYNYINEGYVTTIAFDGGDIETEKQNNRIIVNYKLGTKTIAPTGTTSIDIYTRTNNTDDWVFDCNTVTDKPTIGDKYLYNGLEYTVKEYRSSTGELICSRNENGPQYDSILRSSGTLTKTFGVGDATITFTNVDNFVYLDTISDATKRKKTITWKGAWYELEVMAVLKSTQKSITPELYSIKTLFGYNDQDVG